MLHTEQRDDHWLYEQQFARWKRGALSDAQARKVNRLIEQSVKLKATSETILALAEKITPYTIDKIMATDNDKLGLKAMSGEIDRPGSHELPADMTPPVQDPGTTKTLTDTDKSRLAEQIDERVTTILRRAAPTSISSSAWRTVNTTPKARVFAAVTWQRWTACLRTVHLQDSGAVAAHRFRCQSTPSPCRQ